MSEYFSKFYNEHLMEGFARSFNEFQLINDRNGREILFRDFITGCDGETLNSRNWNSFHKTCKVLNDLGHYSSVIRFMYGVFKCGGAYNLKMLKEKLSGIKLFNGKNLAEMCSSFYLYINKQDHIWLLKHSGEDIPEDIDLYLGDGEDYFDMHSYPLGKITEEMPVFILKYIFDMDIDIEKLSKNDVDEVVKKAIEIKNKAVLEQEKYISEINKDQEDAENEMHGKLHMSRLVNRKITEFDRNIMIPGLLLDLFKASELTGQYDICYYIQTKYVWPVFSDVPWKQKNRLEVQFMGIMIEEYMDSIFSLELGNHEVYHKSDIWRAYDYKSFYEELIGDKAGKLLDPGIKLAERYPVLAKEMAEALSQSKGVIKRKMPEYLYSFAMSFAPYLLYCGGYAHEASAFLLRNYDDISFDDKRKLYVQLTLVRCILSSDRIEEANVLYGYYNYEMDRQARERKSNINFVEDITRYLTDVKEYMELRNDYTIDTSKAWTDVVFGDGHILKDVEFAEKLLAEGKIPSEGIFRKLMTYVDALSYYSGIRLRVLGLNNEDGYDKLPNALSADLINQGRGFVDKYDEYLSYYQSLNHLDIRQNINVFLQQHISRLLDETVGESMEKIKKLRSEFFNDGGPADYGDYSAEEILETKAESLLPIFEEVLNELTVRLESQYIGRADIEIGVAGLQKDFINKYDLKVNHKNLISMLPAEIQSDCNNYLVTSEIVFRMLSNRTDSGELDFSPALIPLTKATELVLNYVFSNMNIQEYKGIDSRTKNSYFNKSGGKKISIEFGPCILMFGDGKIEAKKYNGSIRLSWYHEYISKGSRFEEWNGNNIIDIGRLKKFQDLKILLEYSERNNDGTYTMITGTSSFTGDNCHNRMLLIKGLEYIKNNYRNVVAHKDGVSLQKVEECRKILLQTENLLWILIYILKL